MTSWLNGQVCDQISCFDRGLSYGDGHFTTIKIANGQCCLLLQHLSRLSDANERLSMPEMDLLALQAQLIDIAKAKQHGVIKVLITRGQGPRGYSSKDCKSANILVSVSDFPNAYASLANDGISLGISTVTLGINPLTAGLKHLNRLEQVLIKQEIDAQRWFDAVVLDCQGFVVETNMANLFWVTDSTIYTPNLSVAGVCGVMRARIFELLEATDYRVEIVRADITHLMAADEIFCCNSLMEVVPVIKIAQQIFAQGAVCADLKIQMKSECSQ